MFLIEVDYPTEEEEMRIARETTGTRSEELKHILSGEEIIFYQDLVRRVPVPEHIYEYAVKLVRATRPTLETSPEWVKQYVAWGRRPPRRPVPDSWGQDPRRSPGQLHRPQGRHRRHCGTCADAPRGHQLRRGIPGHHARKAVARLAAEI